MTILLDSFQRDLFFASEDRAKHKSMRLTITRLQPNDIMQQYYHIQALAIKIAQAKVDLIRYHHSQFTHQQILRTDTYDELTYLE